MQKRFGPSIPYSTIIATDYTNYFVEYHCAQAYGDLWTEHYVDVFFKDDWVDINGIPQTWGSFSGGEVKNGIIQLLKVYFGGEFAAQLGNTDVGVCDIEPFWGFWPYDFMSS